MDMSQYKEEFVNEAREHLDNLNEFLLVLEKEPQNMDNINKIFRAFHTLKGNAATMGFTKFSELAHDLEDVLDKVRSGEMTATSDILDLILEGCDVLEEGLQAIKNDDPENIDTSSIIRKLADSKGVKKEEPVQSVNEDASLDEGQRNRVNELRGQGKNVFRIITLFEANNVLRFAKALLIARDAPQFGELIKVNPSHDDLKAGKLSSEFEIVIATDSKKEDLESWVNKISGIKEVSVIGIDEKYESKHHEVKKEEQETKKDIEKASIADKHQSQVVKQIQSVKIDIKRLDHLMNLVGELLISKIRLDQIATKYSIKELNMILAGLDRLSLEIQDEVMQERMIPIGQIFNRFPRMVRDLAKTENKMVNLVVEGAEIEFDRTILDQLGDPLVHLLRNSVDHGVEPPEEREKAGKEKEGTVRLVARREKNNAVVEVSDDGAGIDPKRVAKAAVKRGVITQEEANTMSDLDLQRLVFRPAMSTNEKVTEVSGRGVGMDVVESKIKALGGNVKLRSEVGSGTTVIMQLPLTLAIVTVLLVKVEEDTYAIPLNSVDRTIDIKKSEIKTIKGNEVFVLRGTEIPLFRIRDLLGHNPANETNKYTVVVVEKDESKVGLIIDSIISQQQILIKALQDMLKGTKGMAGATILGDGKVALILDIGSLLS